MTLRPTRMWRDRDEFATYLYSHYPAFRFIIVKAHPERRGQRPSAGAGGVPASTGAGHQDLSCGGIRTADSTVD